MKMVPWIRERSGPPHGAMTCDKCRRSVHADEGSDLPLKEIDRFIAVHQRCGFARVNEGRAR